MESKILELARKLINIPSISKNPVALKEVLKISALELKDYTIEWFVKDEIPSLLAYASPSRPKRFKIILNAHLDVIPAKPSQFSPKIKDGKLYGRGAYDMKAAAAVEILVFKELAKKLDFPLGLQLVTDEEIGGFKGTKYQKKKE